MRWPLGAAVLTVLGAGIAGVVLVASPRGQTPEPVASCRPGPQPPSNPAKARRIYVSSTARPGGDGSRRRPMRSFRRALARLGPGITVTLRPGTYTGTFFADRDGGPGRPAVIQGLPGEVALIRGRLEVGGSHVVVSGLTFDQSEGPVHDVAIFVTGKDDWIAHNEIRHANKSGILVGDGADRLSVVGNWIHDNGTSSSFDHGVYWAGGVGGLLAQNVIDRNAAYGVQLYPNADGILVRRNTIVSNGRAGIVIGGIGTSTSDSDSLAHNIVAFNRQQGIRTSWSGQAGSNDSATDNLAFGNPEGSVGGDGLAVSGTMAVDPTLPQSSTDFRVGDPTVAQLYGAQLDVRCLARTAGAARRR